MHKYFICTYGAHTHQLFGTLCAESKTRGARGKTPDPCRCPVNWPLEQPIVRLHPFPLLWLVMRKFGEAGEGPLLHQHQPSHLWSQCCQCLRSQCVSLLHTQPQQHSCTHWPPKDHLLTPGTVGAPSDRLTQHCSVLCLPGSAARCHPDFPLLPRFWVLVC